MATLEKKDSKKSQVLTSEKLLRAFTLMATAKHGRFV